jgi:serine/threonine protein phosphatase PrpC
VQHSLLQPLADMGCASSSSQSKYAGVDPKDEPVSPESSPKGKPTDLKDEVMVAAKDRRRLSVGQVEGIVDGSPQGVLPTGDEVPREAPMEEIPIAPSPAPDLEPAIDLEKVTIEEMVSKKYGATARRYSFDTITDMAKKPYTEKPVRRDSNAGHEAYGLGLQCRKGLKPEAPNQDSFSVMQVDGIFSMYGVYDGHGAKGHDISDYVKDMLPKLILGDRRFGTSDMPTMLFDKYREMQELISKTEQQKSMGAMMAGTTCTVVVHDLGQNKITVSHVADSTAVLARYTDASHKEIKAIQLTRDHKPDLPDERARIEAAGGRVVFDGYTNHRVYAKNARYPGLNMSRCLGDLVGHREAGCSCEPEVNEHWLCPEDHMLLLCSDGVWEFISPQQAVDIVMPFGPAQAGKAAEKLAQQAWDLWIKEEGGQVVDDITVILVYFKHDR